MLEKFIPQLVIDLELGDTKLKSDVPGGYTLPLDEGLNVLLSEIPNGFSLKCLVAPYPQVREEEFSTRAMLGNLFGQGTHGAILGLTIDGHSLALSQYIDYTVDYKEFRNILEDFINSVDFWHEEALNHK